MIRYDKALCLLRLLGVVFRGVVGRAMITEDGQLGELWNSHLKVGHLFLGGWFQWWYYYFHYYISSLFIVIHIIRGMPKPLQKWGNQSSLKSQGPFMNSHDPLLQMLQDWFEYSSTDDQQKSSWTLKLWDSLFDWSIGRWYKFSDSGALEHGQKEIRSLWNWKRYMKIYDVRSGFQEFAGVQTSFFVASLRTLNYLGTII